MPRNEAAGCPYSAHQSVETRLPYDELSHEIDKNLLSVRVGKNVGKIKTVAGFGDGNMPTVTAECQDALGNKCRPGCTKLNVIPNKAPPAKEPDEEMFMLKASRQILSPDEMRNSLEIELRTPRNYLPLPSPPVSEPIKNGSNGKPNGNGNGNGKRNSKKGKNGKNGKK